MLRYILKEGLLPHAHCTKLGAVSAKGRLLFLMSLDCQFLRYYVQGRKGEPGVIDLKSHLQIKYNV